MLPLVAEIGKPRDIQASNVDGEVTMSSTTSPSRIPTGPMTGRGPRATAASAIERHAAAKKAPLGPMVRISAQDRMIANTR